MDVQQHFTDFYKANADAIFRFCLVRVKDREQALDLTQGTFMRLWQSFNQGKKIDYERALLFRIAHNLIIDFYRKKKNVSLESLADEETGEQYEPLIENELNDIEMAHESRFLIDSIGKLSEPHRNVLYLRFLEGLSPPEIGEVLGISENAASVRIHRGIEELRKITGYAIE